MSEQYPIDNNSSQAANRAVSSTEDANLEAVLADFRTSVHAWSEATYRNRPIVFSPVSRRILGQRSLAWTLSVAVVAGIASAGAYEYHQRDLVRQAAVQREAEHQRQLALEQHAREVDDLLAMVDSDLSREVPSAMEPLASLMADDNKQ
jgi:hypothetical protein